MRIAWCTPFTPHSAIGRFSALVVPVLRQQQDVQVDIWFPFGAGGRKTPDSGRELRPTSEAVLASYDLVIYNLGDHGGYHAALAALGRRVPGLVLLHDVSLIHMVSSQMHNWSESDIKSEFRRWYGAEGQRAAEDMIRDPGRWAFDPANVTKFPMTEMTLGPALGVVTHSEFAAERVRARFVGDTWVLGLPALHFDDGEIEPVELGMLDDRPVILQAGVLNVNKCVPTVIEAFQQAGLQERAQLVIAGFAEPADLAEIRRLVEVNALTDSVKVLGQVSDATLHALRRRSLVATVLRDPCLEAASAVLLDSMAYGLAVLTVDAGHYAEMPDDTVRRVPAPPRAADVAAVLEEWIGDPAKARDVGARARAYVEPNNNPNTYAQGLLDIVGKVGATVRRRDLALTLAHNLRQVGFAGDDAVSRAVARTAAGLFGARPRVNPG